MAEHEEQLEERKEGIGTGPTAESDAEEPPVTDSGADSGDPTGTGRPVLERDEERPDG